MPATKKRGSGKAAKEDAGSSSKKRAKTTSSSKSEDSAATVPQQVQLLKTFQGKYACKMKFDMGGQVMESDGKSVAKVSSAGVVEYDWKGDFLGSPFEGKGALGYSNNEKMFYGDWWDSSSAGLFPCKGKQLSDTTFELHTAGGSIPDHADPNKKKTTRQLWTFEDDGKKITMESFNLFDGDKKEKWSMGCVWTR